MRLLLIDDDRLFASALQRYLARHVDAIVVVSSAEEALATLADQRFDLIFCDQALPGMSGTELVEALRARDPALAARVVLLTGGPAAIDPQRFGGVRVVGKPCDPPTLLAIVKEARARS